VFKLKAATTCSKIILTNSNGTGVFKLKEQLMDAATTCSSCVRYLCYN